MYSFDEECFEQVIQSTFTHSQDLKAVFHHSGYKQKETHSSDENRHHHKNKRTGAFADTRYFRCHMTEE